MKKDNFSNWAQKRKLWKGLYKYMRGTKNDCRQ